MLWPVGVEKVLQRNGFHLGGYRRRFLVSVRLSGGRENRCCRLTEEAHQSLDVLGSRRQEELLTNKLHTSS